MAFNQLTCHRSRKPEKILEMKMRSVTLLLLAVVMASCQTQAQNGQKSSLEVEPKWDLSEQEWKERLTDFEFYVLRDKGTERAFSGALWNHKKDGVYKCAACELALFDSKTKYRSGTGWPSFWEPVAGANIAEDTDHLLGYPRTEVMCARCGGHLGHVFPDGPEPTGLRYCINSVSLSFEERKE